MFTEAEQPVAASSTTATILVNPINGRSAPLGELIGTPAKSTHATGSPAGFTIPSSVVRSKLVRSSVLQNSSIGSIASGSAFTVTVTGVLAPSHGSAQLT